MPNSSTDLISRVQASVGLKEVTFVSIAGQGGAAATELLSAALAKRGWFTSVRMKTPGGRRMAPVINDIKIGREPILPNCANERPDEMLVFTEVLFDNRHPWIVEAIATLERGILMLNTQLAPRDVPFPYGFEGTVATVDATGICERVLGIRPAPFGLTLLGLYARVTGAVDIATLCDVIRDRFPGKIGAGNAAGVREAYEQTRIEKDVVLAPTRDRPGRTRPDLARVLDRPSFGYTKLPGASDGNPALAWRPRLPVIDQSKCTCHFCVTPGFCPDGVITWRDGRYEINYEYCKGCGICAAVCVHSAVTMRESSAVLAAAQEVR
jgi:2-oxoacid:acceptor oxidoreductase delta subunit (pyruvate/2-ketoisovalerate family)